MLTSSVAKCAQEIVHVTWRRETLKVAGLLIQIQPHAQAEREIYTNHKLERYPVPNLSTS